MNRCCTGSECEGSCCGERFLWHRAQREVVMAPKNNPGSKSAADNMTPEQLERALYVPPPPDPQQLEEHVRQLLMRAQVSWLPKRDILDILTNWREYSLPISLMPPDQPGRATPQSSRKCRCNSSWRGCSVQRVPARSPRSLTHASTSFHT